MTLRKKINLIIGLSLVLLSIGMQIFKGLDEIVLHFPAYLSGLSLLLSLAFLLRRLRKDTTLFWSIVHGLSWVLCVLLLYVISHIFFTKTDTNALEDFGIYSSVAAPGLFFLTALLDKTPASNVYVIRSRNGRISTKRLRM